MPAHNEHQADDDVAPSQSEQLFPSTTWEYRKVMVRRPPQALGVSAPKASALPLPRKRPLREALVVTLKYRGGPEGWVEVMARGRTIRVPGHVALVDLLLKLNGHA